MKNIIELDKDDIIQIIANHYNVEKSKVDVQILFEWQGRGLMEEKVPKVIAHINK